MKRFSLGEFRREALENLRLAAPLAAAQLAFVGMHTVDTLMAGRLGADALAAVAVGANVWFLSFIIFMGVFMAVSPIVAQRVGAGRPAIETGFFLRNALLVAVLLGALWMLLIALIADPVLDLLRLPENTRTTAEGYLRAISWSAIPFCLCFVMRNGCEGHGAIWGPVVAGVVALSTNALVNLPLMYGYWGFPALGAVGTAWGTVIATSVMVLVYVLVYLGDPRLKPLRLLRGRPRLTAPLWEIARVGLPISFCVVAEAWLFNIGALLMARFGGDVVAAHQIAINFASLVFMIPLSIGLATTVRVGQAVGAGEASDAALRGRVGMALGAGFGLCSASAIALFPTAVVALYTQAPAVSDLAVRFLGLAAIFQVFDCVQATANGALRGLKDTRFPMALTVLAYWLVGMPAGAWLTFATAVGPPGVWFGFILGLSIAALGLSLRFIRRTRAGVPLETSSVLIS